MFVSKGQEVLCTALVDETVKPPLCDDARLLSCPAGPGQISSEQQLRIPGSFDLSIPRKRRREGEPPGRDEGVDQFVELNQDL